MRDDLNGVEFPTWARWIAQDADGTWWAYEAEPHIAERSWYENEVGESKRLIQTLVKENWKETLRPID